MQITWYTTAAVSIKTDSDSVIFDPFIPFENSETVIDIDEYKKFHNILITHGHIDHISTLPRTIDSETRIFATETPVKTLKNYFGISSECLHQIKPNDKLTFGRMSVNVYQSHHVKFDFRLIFSTLWRILTFGKYDRLKKFLELNKVCQENDETVSYKIEADNVTVLLFGSLSFCREITYPQCDILILPFQGSSYLEKFGLQICKMCNPKTVILDHFDNSFPPISKHIDATKFISSMHKHFPETQVLVPESGKCYTF